MLMPKAARAAVKDTSLLEFELDVECRCACTSSVHLAACNAMYTGVNASVQSSYQLPRVLLSLKTPPCRNANRAQHPDRLQASGL